MLENSSRQGRKPDDRIVAALMAARDNALEDTILQSQRHLRLVFQCFDEKCDVVMEKNKVGVVEETLEAVARGLVLAYQWADIQPGTLCQFLRYDVHLMSTFCCGKGGTWTSFSYLMTAPGMGTPEQRAVYVEAYQDLERLHFQLIALTYRMQQVLRGRILKPWLDTEGKEKTLRMLYEQALKESRDRVNLGPYMSVFQCLLGPPVQKVFEWMEEVRKLYCLGCTSDQEPDFEP